MPLSLPKSYMWCYTTAKRARTRKEKSRVKYKKAHEFYARTAHRASAAGVSCYVCYDLLRSMHDTLSRPKGTNGLAKIPRIGWVYSIAALR